MITLDRLHTFTVAAEELNFTHAARRLGLSQPAISLQIKELEESLAVSLFERTGRKLLLTPAGERLRPLAHTILRSVDQAHAELAAFRSVFQGVLRVGASNTIGTYLLPHALGLFSRCHPGIRASLQISDLPDIARELNDNSLDLALVEEDLTSGRIHGWEKVAICEEEVVAIVPAGHPWGQRPVALAELETESFVLRPRSSPTRQLIMDRLAEAQVDPDKLQVRFELSNTEGIKQAVIAGLGVGFVSRYAVAAELQAGLLQEAQVTDLAIRRHLWLIRPVAAKIGENQQRFCDVILSEDWMPASLRALIIRPERALAAAVVR